MKALTVRQPHASLIAAGVKTIETRGQRTHHRGPLAIHAGLHRPVEGADVGDWWWCWDVDQGAIVRQSEWGQHPAPLGAIVAVVDVVDCVPIDPREWTARTGGPFTGHSKMGDGSDAELWWSDGQRPRITFDWEAQRPYGDFTPGRWAWLLTDVRPLPEPVPCRGAQGLWNVLGDVEAQLGEAVTA
jgi:activating signal cointegrator 1